MQATAEAVLKPYDDENLTAQRLAEFIAAFYGANNDIQDLSGTQEGLLGEA